MTSNGERVAKVERLVLAFGEQLLPGRTAPTTAPESEAPVTLAVPVAPNGSENGQP